MDKAQAIKQAKKMQQSGVIEALRDIGAQTAKTLTHEVFRSHDFIDQIVGNKKSGEIRPGQSVSFNEKQTNKSTEQPNAVAFERYLLQEEKATVERKANELRLQLQAVMHEVKVLSNATQKLSTELKVASMQAPVEAGEYHIVFFEKLMDSIKSFRKKIDSAAVWLHSMNKRAQKKNFWGQAKKGGSGFLLNSESYSQRNTG